MLASALGPILLDLGLDFIPIVGDVKGFAQGVDEGLQGNYGAAIFEFLAILASVIPFSKIITKSGDFLNGLKAVFKSFKIIRAISNFSGAVLTSLKQFLENGWDFIWDGTNTITLKNGDEVMAEFIDIDPNFPITKVKHPSARKLVDIGKIDDLIPIGINPDAATSLASKLSDNPANYIKYHVDEPDLSSIVDDVLTNGDQTGEKTEALVKAYMESGQGSVWTHKTGGKYGSNNGFDNIFEGPGGRIHVDEAKNWAPRLSGPSDTTDLPSQMSDLWIDHVISKITDQELKNKIIFAKDNGLLTKTVSVIKKTGDDVGSLYTIKVE